MPELPDPKFRVAPEPPTTVVPAAEPYAELDVVSNFSFLRGASHPDELVFRAAELGYRALAIVDHNTLAGVVRAHEAAKKCGLKLLIGSRLILQDGPDLIVWCADRSAYARLSRLLTQGKRRAEKGGCALWLNDALSVLAESPGLMGAVLPTYPFEADLEPAILRLHDAMGGPLADRLSIATSCLYGGTEQTRLRDLVGLSVATRVPLVATNGVHYHVPQRRPLQDVLTCVRHTCTIHEAGYRLFPNGERYLKSPAQMWHIFAGMKDALRRTMAIADRCTFTLDELRYEYPDELVPAGKTITQHLRDLTEQGAATRYPEGVPAKVRATIEHELKLIAQLNYEAYFLTVHDLVLYARSRGILCQGRGSAANSAVCWCLGITNVDPNQIDLLFERFVSVSRREPPDIDVDFEHERREEVLQYLYHKYGRQRVGMTGVVTTYRGRSAVRDVGKALGLSLDLVDQLSKRLEGWHARAPDEKQVQELGLDPNDRTIRQVLSLTGELLGFPRHLSQHVGGMVMTRGPLCEMVPIENASMDGRTVIEWDKDDIDTLGILKVDVLALGMLTCISRAFGLIQGWQENRQQGIEALRHEGEDPAGTKGLREVSDVIDSYVSRSDCVAEGHEAGKVDVRSDESNAAGGAVWISESDASGGGVGSIEHCRGIRVAGPKVLSQASEDCAGFTGGIGNAVGVGNDGTGTDSAGFGDLGTASRDRSCIAGPDSRRAAIQTTLDHNGSSCLNASLPSCLPLALHTIPREDPVVYDMICRADTVGVFQIESRAQMSMLPRLRPRCFYDLVIEVAIVRPGPIQGNMVHPYLRRRNGEEPVTYPSQALQHVLEKTLGVPLFQEQAMKVVMVAAGFSADEAEQLRKAMAAWRKTSALEKFQDRVIQGMLGNGYTREFAEQMFEQIRGFGEYGFPESHAASFAHLVYVSCWLKCHHPAAFAAALLNSQPMGFYAPAQIVRDAMEHGVEVLPVDVNVSEWDCFLEEGREAFRHQGTEAFRHSGTEGMKSPAIRLGLRLVKGFRVEQAVVLTNERAQRGRFHSIKELFLRTGIAKPVLRRLAEADAFQSMGLRRRQAIWEVLGLEEPAPLFEGSGHFTSCLAASMPSCLPKMPIGQEVMTDYATAGLSLKAHPVGLVREYLNQRRVISAAQLKQTPAGKWVRVAGLVLVRQRPGTASGIVFETLEDETGIANLIVRPVIYEKYKPAARYATLLEAQGIVERQGDVIHVMVKKMEDLTFLVEGLSNRSRDFH